MILQNSAHNGHVEARRLTSSSRPRLHRVASEMPLERIRLETDPDLRPSMSDCVGTRSRSKSITRQKLHSAVEDTEPRGLCTVAGCSIIAKTRPQRPSRGKEGTKSVIRPSRPQRSKAVGPQEGGGAGC